MGAEHQSEYTLKVAGLTRQLPLRQVSPDLAIASFVMLGDTELVEKTAAALYDKLPKYNIDILVCPEAKAIPLAQELASLLKVNYVVVRKSVKGYMKNPLTEKTKSITTVEDQQLVLDGVDVEKIAGRNVCIVDDVVSTGGSLKSIETLLKRTDCKIVCKAAVLLEEAGYEDPDLVYLERLPVFK
jgi:adenine phosphoribosyltransferase